MSGEDAHNGHEELVVEVTLHNFVGTGMVRDQTVKCYILPFLLVDVPYTVPFPIFLHVVLDSFAVKVLITISNNRDGIMGQTLILPRFARFMRLFKDSITGHFLLFVHIVSHLVGGRHFRLIILCRHDPHHFHACFGRPHRSLFILGLSFQYHIM